MLSQKATGTVLNAPRSSAAFFFIYIYTGPLVCFCFYLAYFC